jgi:ABC-2 type transport system permease protein
MTSMAAAFLRRDFLNWSSYRLQALRELGGLVVTMFAFAILSRILGGNRPDFLAKYNTDYVGYLMTSVTFIEVWGIGFLVSRSLRDSQSLGTLEAMMLSRSGIVRLLLYSTAFPTLIILVRLSLFTFAAVVFFGLWHGANIFSVAAIFLTSILTMGCLGLLSSAFVLLLKQGDPIVPIYGLLNGLLAGAVFPVDVLPRWAQAISFALPLTYALDGMRLALGGAGLGQVAPQVLKLFLILLILLPITAWTLSWATRRAKEEGSLVQY